MKGSHLLEYASQLESMIPVFIRVGRNLETKRLSRYSLTLPQFFALAVLENNGPCKMKELGLELGLSLGTVTGIVDRLIREGLVERYTDQRDRRVVRVKLSSKGEEILRKIHEDRKRALAERISGLSDSELNQLIETLSSIGALFSQDGADQ